MYLMILGSSEALDYELLVSELLSALSLSGSIALLELCLPLLREQRHIYERKINFAMEGLASDVPPNGYAPRMVMVYCLELLVKNFDVMTSVRTTSQFVLLSLIQRVLVPLMCRASPILLERVCLKPDVLSFTSTSILGMLVSKLQSTLPPPTAGGDTHEHKVQIELVVRACAFQVLQAIYERLPVEALKGSVARTFAGPNATGNELTKLLCQLARKVAVSRPLNVIDDTVSPSLKELTRKRQLLLTSSAYNCLALVVSRTQVKEKLFTGLLFVENQKKRELLWAQLIDTQIEMKFSVQTDFSVLKFERNSIRALLSKRNGFGPRYLSSQYYMSNSVHQSLPLFALSSQAISDDIDAPNVGGAGIVGNNGFEGMDVDIRGKEFGFGAGFGQVSEHQDSKKEESKVDEISSPIAESIRAMDEDESTGDLEELELDELNASGSMVTILRVIDHMSRVFGREWAGWEATPEARVEEDRVVNGKCFLVGNYNNNFENRNQKPS